MKNIINKFALVSLITLTTFFFSSSLFAGNHNKDVSKKKDIVTIAVEAGSFKTLATALTEAGLVETLKGEVVM